MQSRPEVKAHTYLIYWIRWTSCRRPPGPVRPLQVFWKGRKYAGNSIISNSNDLWRTGSIQVHFSEVSRAQHCSWRWCKVFASHGIDPLLSEFCIFWKPAIKIDSMWMCMCAISVSNQNMLTLLPDSQMTNYGDHTPFHSICKLSQTFFFFQLTMQVPAIDGCVKDMSLPLRILGDSSYRCHVSWWQLEEDWRRVQLHLVNLVSYLVS